MDNKRERAHDIAEQGLDKIIEADNKAGEELAEEVKRVAERFIGKK